MPRSALAAKARSGKHRCPFSLTLTGLHDACTRTVTLLPQPHTDVVGIRRVRRVLDMPTAPDSRERLQKDLFSYNTSFSAIAVVEMLGTLMSSRTRSVLNAFAGYLGTCSISGSGDGPFTCFVT